LLKLLKVPVVTAIVKGAYSSMPRWGWANRFGRVEIEFKLTFSPDELKQLKADEVLVRLQEALEYDEAAWQQERHIPFRGKARAESLETVLFLCPVCGNSESMRSVGHGFTCTACGASWHLDRFYDFHPKSRNGSHECIQTIRDWSLWQTEAYTADVLKRVGTEGRDTALLLNDNTSIYRGCKLDPLRKIATGQLVLFPDRLELQTGKPPGLSFPLEAIEGEGVFKRNYLEFYHGRILYQVNFPGRSTSARKWLMTLGVLRRFRLENPLPPG
jgi:1-acyl-sn-glycerol-3-phosphate acyltransferase